MTPLINGETYDLAVLCVIAAAALFALIWLAIVAFERLRHAEPERAPEPERPIARPIPRSMPKPLPAPDRCLARTAERHEAYLQRMWRQS